MNFDLSPDHETFRKVVREFAEAEIAPHAARWDREHHFPVEVVPALGELGLFGLTAPEEYGGAGGDFTSLCVAIEEIGRVDQSIGITIEAAVGLGINPILTYGTEEQKQRWLPDLVTGRALAALRADRARVGIRRRRDGTRAVLDDGEWVIDGSKQFITNSGTPHHLVRDGDGPDRQLPDGRAEVSTIIVPTGTPGFTVGARLRQARLARLATPTRSPSPAAASRRTTCSGSEGRGFAQFLATLDDGRIAIAALARRVHPGDARAVGGLRRRAHRVRRARSAASRASPSRSPTSRSWPTRPGCSIYRAAALRDAGRPHAEFKQAAAVAKLYATESAVTATRIATQVFGGYGFMEEYPVARFYRDAKILEIGEGTSEVQRMLIARGLGLPVE